MNGKTEEKKITLAIETAIGGGSLSLLEKDSVLDHWNGEREVSRSEELLEAISLILRRNKLCLEDLDTIAVSRGPGSYTGVRIGLATAIGLSNGSNIQKCGVSLIDSFYNNFKTRDQNLMVGLSFGRNEVCYGFLDELNNKNASDKKVAKQFIKISSIEEFADHHSKMSKIQFIFDDRLYKKLIKFKFPETKMINAGLYLADFVGQFKAINNFKNISLLPIYPRNM